MLILRLFQRTATKLTGMTHSLYLLPISFPSAQLSFKTLFSSTISQTSLVNMSSNDLSLDDIFQAKRTLRSKVKKELRGMTPEQRLEQDTAIQNIVLESQWFKSSRRLCAYISCSALREVDTSKILSEILQDPTEEVDMQIKKKLYVPRVEDKNSYMRMLNISRIDDLLPNSMNILEPAPLDGDGIHREDVMDASDPVDLLLLPGLAFDKTGRRLGRGGGYYDMFLTKYRELCEEQQWEKPLLVALSYREQIVDEGVISITTNDVPVDALVTPDGVIHISADAIEKM